MKLGNFSIPPTPKFLIKFLFFGLALALSPVAQAQNAALPAWLDSPKNRENFYQRAPYNFAITQIPALNRDMNGVAVGHTLAYEALVTGRQNELETRVWAQIDAVLKNPPRLMPTEKALSPTFARRYGVLENVFDWTHVSHAQTIDNFVSSWADNAQKDRETARLWDFYKKEGAPFIISGLPMNMAWLDSRPYSGAFRHKYPKVNALFWGYHWLQTGVYDGLRGKNLEEQKRVYEQLGRRYREVELYDTRRPFMPMMAETSPRFSAQFPEIANGFDNLHMLHDMVNDILATDTFSPAQKNAEIRRAIFQMSAEAHKTCKPGENRGVIDGVSHDHRWMDGMPGMGLMKGNETQTAKMWMDKMGWMEMANCHHCSMPLPKGEKAWQASTVSAQSWTMRVRCALCARDMSAETKGGAILSLATEDPDRPLTVFSDDAGNLTTFVKGAVFLEEPASHASCSRWSQAFSSRAAFEDYVAKNPKFEGSKALSFEEWASVEAAEMPDTYEKLTGENPYAAAMKARDMTRKDK